MQISMMRLLTQESIAFPSVGNVLHSAASCCSLLDKQSDQRGRTKKKKEKQIPASASIDVLTLMFDKEFNGSLSFLFLIKFRNMKQKNVYLGNDR